VTGAALASQPTLSRFENAGSPWTLARMGRTLATTVIAHHRARLQGRAQRITIDLDPTDDPTHGQQAFTFFNGHYDTWCYLPLVATLTFNDEAEQYVVAIVLRPRQQSGDAGRPWAAAHAGAASAPRLPRRGPPGPRRWRVRGERVAHRVGDAPGRVCGGAGEQRAAGTARGGGSWAKPMAGPNTAAAPSTSSGRRPMRPGVGRIARRVIIKAEVVRLPGRDPRCNPRFVVTNLREAPATVYALYCQRGDMENRLKELHDGLALGRTSCSQFWANQFRVLLTTAASVLLQELRRQAHGTDCARAQVSTLRERLLKLAVWGGTIRPPAGHASAPLRAVGRHLAPRGGSRSAPPPANAGSCRVTIAASVQTACGRVCPKRPPHGGRP
jgi:hypothetical protein